MTMEAAETQIESMEAQIKSIEAQIAALKAQHAALEAEVKQMKRSPPPKTLGDLRGILAGLPDFTEEEIDAALYRFDWEEEGETSE
jgi:protein required for attachment to host cells